MIRLIPILLVAGCTAVEMGAPVAYVSACPLLDNECTRRQNAQTLYYIGEPDAAQFLMCQDIDVAKAIGEGCNVLY